MRTQFRKLAIALISFVAAVTTSTAIAAKNLEFLVGNDIWQPGNRYRDDANWFALSCAEKECAFERARLSVRREQWQGHYDDRPTSGQKLTFKKVQPSSGKVIAWFRRNNKVGWLVRGSVSTYASTASGFKRPDTEGTLELAVDTPNGSEARLVPLYDQKNVKFLLQLREGGRRQMLGELAPCSHEVSLDYLVWAGDLDKDGRPDYLVNFVDSDGEVVLYLSGSADAKNLVGIGGVYVAPPWGGECDGSGWIGR